MGTGLFERREPSVAELVTYIVAAALAREATITQTKLVKLLYLVDVRKVERSGRSLTGLEWVFYDYGPYAFELRDELERMENREIITKRVPRGGAQYDTVLYVAALDPPDADATWPLGTKMLVDNVVTEWADADLNRLLDYVYFQTPPMQNATRGRPLVLAAPGSARLPTTYRPLPAPPRPTDADERLANWRERVRRRHHVPLDPSPRYDAPAAADREADDEVVARGTLSVDGPVEW